MDVKLAHFEEAPVVKLIFSVSHNPVFSQLASSCHVRKVLTSFLSCHTCKPVHDTNYLFRHLNFSPKLTTQLQILNTLVLNESQLTGLPSKNFVVSCINIFIFMLQCYQYTVNNRGLKYFPSKVKCNMYSQWMPWSYSVFYSPFIRSIYISTSGSVLLAKFLLNYSQNITLKFTYHVLQLLQNYRQYFRKKT